MIQNQKGGRITIRVPVKPNPSTPIKAPVQIKPLPVIKLPTPIKLPPVIKLPTPTLPPTLQPIPSVPIEGSAPTLTVLPQLQTTTSDSSNVKNVDPVIIAYDSFNKFVEDIKVNSKSLSSTDDINRLTAEAYNVTGLAVIAKKEINKRKLQNSIDSSIANEIQFQEHHNAIILAFMKLMIDILNLRNEMDISGSLRPTICLQASITKILDNIPTITKLFDNALQLIPKYIWIVTLQDMLEEIKQTYTMLLSQISATTTQTPEITTQTPETTTQTPEITTQTPETTTQTPEITTQTPETTTQTPETTTQTPEITTQTPLAEDEQAIQVTFELYSQFVNDLKIRINSPANTNATSILSNQHENLKNNAMVTEVLINRALENDSNNTKLITYKQNITVMIATITFMRYIINQQYWVAKSDNILANQSYIQSVLDTIPPVTTAINNALQIVPENSWIIGVQNTIEEIKQTYTMLLSKLSATTTPISGGRSRKVSSKKRTSTYRKKRTVTVRSI